MSLPIVILAGGLGTRLGEISWEIPKALIKVNGVPFLEHQIELLHQNAITDIVLCVGHLGHLIERKYGDGEALRVQIRYSHDGATLLGTGGAIKKALPLLPDAFFVLYGDSYLPINYQVVASAFHQAGKPALMTVLANADVWDASNVWFENNIIRLYSKQRKLAEMRHIDYGLMICTKRIFDHSHEAFDLAEVLESLSKKGDLAGYEIYHRFYQIGSREGLAELDHFLSMRLPHGYVYPQHSVFGRNN